MERIQDSFSKVSCQSNFSNLPIELLLPISVYLDDGDFNALVCSNKELYQHLNGTLYKRLTRKRAWQCMGWAIRRDSPSTVKHIIEAGYDINQRGDLMGVKKCTPIALACFHNKLGIFKLLLNHGADPTGPCWGEKQTLLTLCLRMGHVKIARLLINDDRINIHAKDGYGQTPLMLAVQSLTKVVGLLIDKGADPYVKSNLYRDNTCDYYDEKLPTKPSDFYRYGCGRILYYMYYGYEEDIYGLEIARFTQQPENKTPLQQAAHHGSGPHISHHFRKMFDKSLELTLAGKAKATPVQQYCNSFYGAARFGLVHNLQTWIKHFGDRIDPNQVEGEMCNTPFGAAVREGEMGTVEVLWNWSKVDPTIPSPEISSTPGTSFTPLYQAADHGHEEIVKLLIDSGKFDLNYTHSSWEAPLAIAAANGHEGIVKILLDGGKFNLDYTKKFGETPMLVATANGHEAVVKLLIDSGKLDLKYTNSSGQTSLAVTVTKDHKEIIQLLLDSGRFNVNYTNSSEETPMVDAVTNGHEGVIRVLIDNGKFDVDYTESCKDTPIVVAAANGHEGVVRALIDSGRFDVNDTDGSGETPLTAAATNGHEGVVRLLLRAGADPNKVSDSLGTTAIWEVAASGSLSMMNILLDTPGIEADLKCYGKTPLENARANRREGDEVVQELKKFLGRK